MTQSETRMVERKTGLHARARRARLEAVDHLGADAQRFRASIDRYTNAVEVADQARREWERLERPLWTKGSQGQLVEHPLVRTMDRLERAAAVFGDALGLTPAAERRIGRMNVSGRPVGATSAPDRRPCLLFAVPEVKRRSEPPRVLRGA